MWSGSRASRPFPFLPHLPNDKFTQSPLRARDEIAGTFYPAGILLLVSICPKRDIVEVAVSSNFFFKFQNSETCSLGHRDVLCSGGDCLFGLLCCCSCSCHLRELPLFDVADPRELLFGHRSRLSGSDFAVPRIRSVGSPTVATLCEGLALGFRVHV